MSIKSDKWIRRMAAEHGMIEPFEPGQVREVDGKRIVSYGTSSYGYDIRCSNEFKIFTNLNSTIVDPKNFDPDSFVDKTGAYCIIPPNSFALARTVEYFRIPRNVLSVCVGKSTYARCFRGDTKVALADGTIATLEEMATRGERGESFFGYSIGANGRLMIARLDSPRYIGRDALTRIDLDNGQSVFATPDHQFMLRDGRMLLAHDLRPDDALMPLYRSAIVDDEMIYDPAIGDSVSKSRLLHEVLHRFDVATPTMPNVARANSAAAISGVGSSGYRNHRVIAVCDVPGDHDVYCLTVPEAGNFALEAGVFVHNCGIIVNVTPFEPEWEGYVTLEFSNTTPLPAKIYANEGVAQVMFFEADEVCETSYKDRGGKYQGQHGVTLPKM